MKERELVKALKIEPVHCFVSGILFSIIIVVTGSNLASEGVISYVHAIGASEKNALLNFNSGPINAIIQFLIKIVNSNYSLNIMPFIFSLICVILPTSFVYLSLIMSRKNLKKQISIISIYIFCVLPLLLVSAHKAVWIFSSFLPAYIAIHNGLDKRRNQLIFILCSTLLAFPLSLPSILILILGIYLWIDRGACYKIFLIFLLFLFLGSIWHLYLLWAKRYF